MENKLLDRFLSYVKVNTSSDENSQTIPSTLRQFNLANMLVDEMKEMGIEDAHVDENCYVQGYISASAGCEDAPAIGFISHMDTVLDFCTKPIHPIVHENYDGKDIYLEAGDRTITVKDFPELKNMKGRTLITSDGTTILGADDKAGIAEILTAAETIIKENRPHGRICIAFTSDEEIGSGAELLDLEKFGAKYAYTMDGDIEGSIQYETFNAASVKIEIKGVNVHPGSAKNIMVNASAVAAEFHCALPQEQQPRYTQDYQGFYHLIENKGCVESASMYYIIRDHDRKNFEWRKKVMTSLVTRLNRKYGPDTIKISIKDSYYNMAEIISNHMHLVDHAKTAIEMTGMKASIRPVRGGTDGARLSFRGLPCPNLGTGSEGFHGPLEHASLEGMERSVQIILNIVDLYSKEKQE